MTSGLEPTYCSPLGEMGPCLKMVAVRRFVRLLIFLLQNRGESGFALPQKFSWGAMRAKIAIFKGGKWVCSAAKIFNRSWGESGFALPQKVSIPVTNHEFVYKILCELRFLLIIILKCAHSGMLETKRIMTTKSLDKLQTFEGDIFIR
jgi:hypothetical protein